MKTSFRVFSRVSRAALLLLMAIPTYAVEIVAHRGASYDAPENTLSAMKLAWKQKADAIELDIYLTKDGKIALMHDVDTTRTGGVEKKVVEQTWDELQKLDVGSWKAKKYAGEKIPNLDSCLATIPDGKRCFIEIKIGSEILPELEKVMKASGKKPEQLAIITFKYDVARDAKARFPKHPVYWLYNWKKEKGTDAYPNIDELIKKAKEANLDGLDLNYGFPIDKAFVQKVKDAGLQLYTWTVDDPEVAKAEVAAGVAGITTNRPEYLRKQLK
jgi:glycerophosphoryl diester phosphodiesterase